MSLILNEVHLIQNPALGAHLLHTFAHGYSPKNIEPKGIPLILIFLVLPLIFHEDTCSAITTTQPSSGLRLFQQKFKKGKDRLLSFHDRAIKARALSLSSLQIALSSGLLAMGCENAELWLLNNKSYVPTSEQVKKLEKAAKKLGLWFSLLSVTEVVSILRVDL